MRQLHKITDMAAASTVASADGINPGPGPVLAHMASVDLPVRRWLGRDR